MRLALLFLWLILPSLAGANAVQLVKEQPATGSQIPGITLIDDAGRTRSVRELQGLPTFLLPIYTRCEDSCITITDSLKEGLSRSNLEPLSYRVILFSFDAADTPEDLAEFRRKRKIPLSWTLATAAREDIHALMESIGFRYATADNQYAHPNLIVALDSEQKIRNHLLGTRPAPAILEDGFAAARGQVVWDERYFRVGFALLAFLLTLSTAYLIHLIGQRKQAQAAGTRWRIRFRPSGSDARRSSNFASPAEVDR